jgi:AcrR family transcriptional regulator
MKRSASIQSAAATDARHSAPSMINSLEKTLRQIQGEGADLSIAAIARRAHVSRTSLYQNSAARQLVADFMSDAEDNLITPMLSDPNRSKRHCGDGALNAEGSLRSSHQEIVSQRGASAELLGRIRDLESRFPPTEPDVSSPTAPH